MGAERAPQEVTAQERRSAYALRNERVEEGLVSGEYRDLLETHFGEEAYDELQVLATRAQSARVRGGPRVLILPGIMGSTLGTAGVLFDDVIWVDPADIIAGNLTLLSLSGGRPDIEPLGVILLAYLKLKLRLKLAGFDASFHPFDWRRDIRELGRLLAERIRAETEKRPAAQTCIWLRTAWAGWFPVPPSSSWPKQARRKKCIAW